MGNNIKIQGELYSTKNEYEKFRREGIWEDIEHVVVSKSNEGRALIKVVATGQYYNIIIDEYWAE